MQSSGVWDIAELYDVGKDPEQMTNLLNDTRPTHNRGRISMNLEGERKKIVDELQARLHTILTDTGGDARRSGKGSEGDRYAL